MNTYGFEFSLLGLHVKGAGPDTLIAFYLLLDFVERYLKPYAGKMADLPSAYMAVLWPVAVGKPLSHVLFAAPTAAYEQNKGLDTDKDGKVTKAEAAAKVQRMLVEGMRPENFG